MLRIGHAACVVCCNESNEEADSKPDPWTNLGGNREWEAEEPRQEKSVGEMVTALCFIDFTGASDAGQV